MNKVYNSFVKCLIRLNIKFGKQATREWIYGSENVAIRFIISRGIFFFIYINLNSNISFEKKREYEFSWKHAIYTLTNAKIGKLPLFEKRNGKDQFSDKPEIGYRFLIRKTNIRIYSNKQNEYSNIVFSIRSHPYK